MTTRQLAEGVHALGAQGLPAAVRAEVLRSLLDVVATSVGAARTPGVDLLVASAVARGGAGRSPVPGRSERLDLAGAALVTGFAAHRDDDGTHPAAAVWAAALPLVARTEVAPARLLDALALGMETSLRVALAMAPSHDDAGWHVAGTVGPLGAAVTAALLQGLDAEQLRHAVAIASSTVLGHGEAVGTMAEAFHPGKAAANGLLAAALAGRGFTGAEKALEGPRGCFRGLAQEVDLSRLTDGLGTSWALLDGHGGVSVSRPVPDDELDAQAAALVERTFPGRGPAVVAEVRALPTRPDCSSFLTALLPETT